jgi:hypothetical protein
MDFDPASLAANLAVSSVGFVLFRYGRGQRRFPHMTVGALMMGYPYFVNSVGWMLGLVPVMLLALWGATFLGL